MKNDFLRKTWVLNLFEPKSKLWLNPLKLIFITFKQAHTHTYLVYEKITLFTSISNTSIKY